MKKLTHFILITLFLTTLVLPSQAGEEKEIKALLIGASFWSAGGRAEKVLKEMLQSQGYNVTLRGQRGNAGTLFKHYMHESGQLDKLIPSHRNDKVKKQAQNDVDGMKKSLGQNPGFVLFQAHSTEAFVSDKEKEENFERIIPFLREHAPDSKIILCMTWIKDSNRSEKKWEQVFSTYRNAAQKYNLPVAPSGVAFHRINQERPDIMLYRSEKDGHPNVRGQYLQCCVVYALMTGKSPVGLPFSFNGISDDKTGEAMDLKPDIAKYLQETAWAVVQEEGGTSLPSGSTTSTPASSKAASPKTVELTCNRTYNSGNQLIQETSSGGKTKEFTYSEAGHPATETMKDSSGKETSLKTYHYDGDKLTHITVKTPAGEGRDQYTYDENGHRSQYQNIDSSGTATETEKYICDSEGRIIEQRNFSEAGDNDLLIKFAYNADGLPSTEDHLDPASDKRKALTTYTYKDKLLTEKLTQDASGNMVLRITYTYDDKGNPTLETHANSQGTTKTVTYHNTY